MWVDDDDAQCYASAMSVSIADVEPLINRICPLLAGHPPNVQGVVLADLVATWVGGHVMPSAPTETDAMREDLLQQFLALVRELITVTAAENHNNG